MCTWGKKNLKFLVPLLLGVVLFAIPLSNSFLQAQGLDPAEDGSLFGPCTINGTPGTYMYGAGQTLECVATGTNITETATTKPEPPSEIGFWDVITSPRILVAWLLYIVLEILGWFLAISAYILDASISFSITNMSKFFAPGTGIGAGINAGWSIIRDLVNIVFVFALLFVGINTILGSWSSSSFNTKLIPKILLAALLINFSMLFTKIVIDTSNILTLELYTAAQKYDTKSAVLSSIGVQEKQGLSGAIMDKLGVVKFMGGKLTSDGSANEADVANADKSILTNVTMAIIVVLIAMFVFLVLAFMLLARMVIFIILIMTSPIAFIGELLPQLKSQSSKWWEALWGQAFFAPVFFALLLVVFAIISDPGFDTTSASFSSTGTGFAAFLGGSAATLIKYFIVIYLLVAALIIAKSVSSTAGKGAAALGSKLAGGAVFGAGAFAGRQILGRTGSALSQTGFAKEWSNSNSFGKRIIGRSIIDTGAWSGKQSFDARSLKAAGGLDAGKAGGKGGYEQWMKDQEKAKKKREERYGAPTREADDALAAARKAETEAKRDVRSAEINVRLAKTDQERFEAEERLVTAEEKLTNMAKERESAETRTKRETAESQISNARREQQTFGTAQGLGNKASALWSTIVNPADREAARKFEEDAVKERNKNTPPIQTGNIDAALKKIEERAREWGIWDETANKGKGGVKEVKDLPGSTVMSAEIRQQRLLKRQADIINERATKGTAAKDEAKRKKDLKEELEKIEKEKKDSEAPKTEPAEAKPEAK